MRRLLLAAPALCLALPATATAQEDAFAERDRRSDALLERLAKDPADSDALRRLESLADECERTADHRVGKYVAGQLIRYEPDQRRHLYRYVRILRARGDHDEAERELEDLVRTRPSVREGWDMLADLQYDQGRYEDALETYARCLEEHPGDARAMDWRTWVYLLDLGDLDAAEAEVARMEKAGLDPTRGQALQTWLADTAEAHAGRIRQQRVARDEVGERQRSLDRWLRGVLISIAVAGAALFHSLRTRS